MWRESRRHLGRLWQVAGAALAVLGLAGLPDDLARWAAWIGPLMPPDLAERLPKVWAALAAALDHGGVRAALVLTGFALLFWHVRWFERVRYRIRMAGRSIMADEVWVSEADAMEAIRRSDWAQLRLPHVTEAPEAWQEMLARLMVPASHQTRTVYGLSDAEKARRKYEMFLARTLAAFAESNPPAVREEGGEVRYERGALLRFLGQALDEELRGEFGEPPRHKVT